MDGRREFLLAAGAMALAAGEAQAETLTGVPQPAPAHHIRFAVCGISHDHIHGMIGVVQGGGGELVAWWGAEPDKRAEFLRRYPNAKVARNQDEVLHDPSVQLVLSAQVASERAGIHVSISGWSYCLLLAMAWQFLQCTTVKRQYLQPAT
jgi:hypothetical protein